MREPECCSKRERTSEVDTTCNAGAVSHAGVRLSRQLGLIAVKYSTNARDIHFLRSLGKRAVDDAARKHDQAVTNTLAVVMGQAPGPLADTAMCAGRLPQMTAAFQEAVGWLRLPGMLGVRPWGVYGDAAHVAMWTQAFQSAQLSFGGVSVCAYPTIARTIQTASALTSAPAG
eukprot:SAG11_NODE_4181_length_2025_cov_1.713396_4_plen_173_part_00